MVRYDPAVYDGAAVHYRCGRAAYSPGLEAHLAGELGLDGSGRLLDVGCPGILIVRLAGLFEEAVGLDPYRDATLFKVMYGWGLRRTETSKLDLADWGRNPSAPEFGRYGTLHVRYGKAKRGQPPRRRNVVTVMAWAAEAVGDYVENVRPRFGCEDHPALWVTERGGRVRPAEINSRFVAYRDALGLPPALVPHSIRHSYVSHHRGRG